MIKTVTIVSVSSPPKQIATVVWNLKWGPDDVAVINKNYSVEHKMSVEGKTAEQLITLTAIQFKKEMQADIDRAKAEIALVGAALHETARLTIEGQLNG